MAAGQPPDIWRTQAPLVPQWAKRGRAPQPRQVLPGERPPPPWGSPAANDYYRYANGKTGVGPRYGMVKDWSPDETVWINTALFKQTGIEIPGPTDKWTYDDLRDIALKLKAKNKSLKWILDIANSYAWIDRHVMVQLASIRREPLSGGLLPDQPDEQPGCNGGVPVLLPLLAAEARPRACESAPGRLVGTGFVAGKIAMTQYGYWFLGMISDTGRVVKNLACSLRPPGKAASASIRRLPRPDGSSARGRRIRRAWEVFEWYMGGKPARERASGWGVQRLASFFDGSRRRPRLQRNAKKTLLYERRRAVLQYNPYRRAGRQHRGRLRVPEVRGGRGEGKDVLRDFMKKVEADTNRAIRWVCSCYSWSSAPDESPVERRPPPLDRVSRGGGRPSETGVARLLRLPLALAARLHPLTSVPLVLAFAMSLFEPDDGEPAHEPAVRRRRQLRPRLPRPRDVDSLHEPGLLMATIVPLWIVTQLGLALILNSGVNFLGLWRTLFYVAVVVPFVAKAFIWKAVFAPDGGLVNRVLGAFGGNSNVDWMFDHPRRAGLPALGICGTRDADLSRRAQSHSPRSSTRWHDRRRGGRQALPHDHAAAPTPVIMFQLVQGSSSRRTSSSSRSSSRRDWCKASARPCRPRTSRQSLGAPAHLHDGDFGYGAAIAWIFVLSLVVTALVFLSGRLGLLLQEQHGR